MKAGPLSTAIDDLLAALGLSNVTLQARLGARWPEVVGPLFSERTAPAKLRRGLLTVVAENHSLSQELQFMKPVLIRNVAGILGADAVTDVRIVVGEVPRRPDAAEPPAADAAEAPHLPQTPDPAGLENVPDPETREILRAISRKAASRNSDGLKANRDR